MNAAARKRYGQHFLHDRDVIDRIVNEVDCGIKIIEIGPGKGALTFPILEKTGYLEAVEIDHDLADYLETHVRSGNLKIHRQDALKVDFCKQFPGQLNLIGNLPYNISTPLMFHLLEFSSCINQMLFMLQKEVADRICAVPDTKAYGRLTVMIQSSCRIERLFDIKPESFTPIPKVFSTVIRIIPGKSGFSFPASYPVFKSLVRTAFSKRRKTIRNALKGLLDEDRIAEAGIDPGSRPENIHVDAYIRLADKLYNSGLH